MPFSDYLDMAGVIPGVSTIVNGGRSVVNLGMSAGAAISGDDEAAEQHLMDAQYYGLGAVPFLGGALSAAEFVHDYATSPAEDECVAPITEADGSQGCDAYLPADDRSFREKVIENVIKPGNDKTFSGPADGNPTTHRDNRYGKI